MPDLSVIVVAYNMARELPRTLLSLSRSYQRDMADLDYEVIVVDNGSSPPLAASDVASFGPQFQLLSMDKVTASPGPAINKGVEASQSPHVAIMVDGARIASPGLLANSLRAARSHDNSVVATLSWHLGPGQQQETTRNGYTSNVEDELLADADWTNHGYHLFEVSSLSASSRDGYLTPLPESNFVVTSRRAFDSIGGMDERFQMPGGGLINLDYLSRCVSEGLTVIHLVGEGTFHQVHGGVTTGGAGSPLLRFDDLKEEYAEIRGETWSRPQYDPLLFGTANPLSKPFFKADRSTTNRRRDVADAASLKPGDDHYRAYVGPPDRYDIMGASQFGLLTALGMRDTSRVLDVGCGSLRVGKLLIPYLQAGKYYGLEPNRWLIDDARDFELGQDIFDIKRPTFRHEDDFSIHRFETSFDFIIAQSVLSHTGPSLTRRALDEISRALTPDGLAVLTFFQVSDGEAPAPATDAWLYPDILAYDQSTVRGFLEEVGAPSQLSWWHPRQTWWLLAKNPSALPPEDLLASLKEPRLNG